MPSLRRVCYFISSATKKIFHLARIADSKLEVPAASAFKLISASRETFFLIPQGLPTAALIALFSRKQIVARQRTWKPRS
ncbi:MAG: hypothetical protein CMQ45_10800 [Gammaproteobacteria bacterium]|nr:hypothetical protein [Gammaproteobacteria bacterium]